MRYTTEIEIDLPRARVIELFDDQENMFKWQPELVSFEHQSGEPGQVGATSRLVYKMGKRDCEMIETITRRELPDQFDGTYQADGMFNSIENRFEELGADRTRWVCVSEFVGQKFAMKAMLLLMPGAFKKETMKFLQRFKAFAEGEGKS